MLRTNSDNRVLSKCSLQFDAKDQIFGRRKIAFASYQYSSTMFLDLNNVTNTIWYTMSYFFAPTLLIVAQTDFMFPPVYVSPLELNPDIVSLFNHYIMRILFNSVISRSLGSSLTVVLKLSSGGL
ncbi:hypothetical protein NPIL_292081 [Nephila pilipes]|uniref:Uncharacterized protein n=1 Tax=Nephila pilipes TaxID=299642 RepID=A0A8X6QPR4_NEPPI|nr:hypothetical protein NPIL_292081 [Nephila pilipes]